MVEPAWKAISPVRVPSPAVSDKAPVAFKVGLFKVRLLFEVKVKPPAAVIPPGAVSVIRLAVNVRALPTKAIVPLVPKAWMAIALVPFIRLPSSVIMPAEIVASTMGELIPLTLLEVKDKLPVAPKLNVPSRPIIAAASVVVMLTALPAAAIQLFKNTPLSPLFSIVKLSVARVIPSACTAGELTEVIFKLPVPRFRLRPNFGVVASIVKFWFAAVPCVAIFKLTVRPLMVVADVKANALAFRVKSCPAVPIVPPSVIVPVVVIAVMPVGKVKPSEAVKSCVPKASVPFVGKINFWLKAEVKSPIVLPATVTSPAVKHLVLEAAQVDQLVSC